MCEKCRMMELFDEELARFESCANGEAFSIARHRYALERRGISEGRAMVIAHGEPFQEQTDPLAEWKALEPGRKVLEIETKDILRVGNKDEDGLFLQRSNYHELDMFTWEKLSNGYQILHEGQFDASKITPDKDYVYVTGLPDIMSQLNGWQIAGTSKYNTLVWISDDCNGIGFRADGTRSGLGYFTDARLHFSPPTPPTREERIEKAKEKIIRIQKHPQCTFAEYNAEITSILTELMEASHD